MLPTSRVISVLLMGLGAALAVVSLLAPRLIDRDARLPLDVGELTWTLRDESARSMVVADPQRPVVTTPVVRQMHVTLEEPSTRDQVMVRVGTSQLRESRQEEADRLISAQVWSYGMDRTTGAATGPAVLSQQLASPTTEVVAPWPWWKFPSLVERRSYEVFDETLRAAFPAEFQGAQERDGREVYHFRQVIEPTNVAQRYPGVVNTTQWENAGEGAAERGFLFHSATRDYYVDRVSGLVVDAHERIDDYYGTADGVRREQVLSFDGGLAEGQSERLLEAAGRVTERGYVGAWSWAGIVAGVALVAAGALGALRPGPRRARSSSRGVARLPEVV
ncbi:DUF3068 domain-containing protein [Corynebacterium sp. zg-331]|uniref:DUF3068 domain-containing protein n=1 Tax=unclassified Corynebacterium TaxID=2624378 RepID=UPI00128C64FF|nr:MULTISPECIES: DUF3068 domain-containing protein [unclassified Corynebacterium]MBC3186067.1 DUF3068 domain-containing protein [Corynebacterium sp. zg-331]MPV52557.1 DUF3068 domain-containing protein [Corynebacterium sp. zg331]